MRTVLSFIALFLLPYLADGQPYKYLVLKGGGIRGIAYTGAFRAMEEQKITDGIEKVAGTSVGAITGTLFCLGYTAKQMEDLMFDLDISSFNDGQWFFIGGQKRFRKNFGWYKGRELERWIAMQIKSQTGNENTTFLQLHQLSLTNRKFKDLYVTATNLTTQRLEIFSWETHPNMPIKVAVRASAAVPLYFGAVFTDSSGNVVEHPKKTGQYNVYVDGGLLANYPINIFNSDQDMAARRVNEYTLGLKLDRPEQIEYSGHHAGIAPYHIQSFMSYIAALYNLTIEQLNKSVPYEEEKKHTVYISTGNYSPRVRRITDEQKNVLFSNGYQAAAGFFKK